MMMRPTGTKRLFRLFDSRRALATDVDDELRFHVACRVDELVAQGLPIEDARRAALADFGDWNRHRGDTLSVDQQGASTRRVRELIESVGSDLRYGWRSVVRGPAFSVTVVSVLGIALAACVVLFTAVTSVLLRGLPFEDSDRLAFVWSVDARRPSTRMLVSYADFTDWRERTRAFTDLAALRITGRSLVRSGVPIRVAAISATPSVAAVLRLTALRGRMLTEADASASAPPVALLTHGFWSRAFGSEPTVLGATIRLDGAVHTVVGILPAALDEPGLLQADVWVPLSPDFATANERTDRSYLVMGRLRDGIDPTRRMSQATSELDGVARALAAEHPESNAGWLTRITSVREATGGDARVVMMVMGIVVGLVLLVACANVGGLMLARGASRRRETAVRLALGASRWRLVRQALVESVLLALLAAVLAVSLAQAGIRILPTVTRAANPIVNQLSVDWRVLALTVTLALITPLLFGVVPALLSLRRQSGEDLKAGGARGNVGVRARGRRVLVISQFAMTMALLAITSLLVRTAMALRDVDLGFDPVGTLMMRLDLAQGRYPTDNELLRISAQFQHAISAVPGVVASATANRVPIADREMTARFFILGRPAPSNSEADWTARAVVSPGFFEVLRIPLRSGRWLSDTDRLDSPPVALINESLARRYWPGGDAVGGRIRFDSLTAETPWTQVVGVVGDVRNSDADQAPVPQVYLPIAQQPQRMIALLVRGNVDPLGLVEPIRRQIAAVDADQAAYDVRTMSQVVSDDLASTTILAALFATFGIIALTLALTGLYGMMAWSVGQRTSEVGLRLALGAQPRDIFRQFAAEAAVLVAGGLAIGFAAGIGLAQLTRGALYGLAPIDPITFVTLPALLIAVGLAAAAIPSRRAARVQPLQALRYD